MRHQHKKYGMDSERLLVSVLSILAHLAAIVGTAVAILDALHHW